MEKWIQSMIVAFILCFLLQSGFAAKLVCIPQKHGKMLAKSGSHKKLVSATRCRRMKQVVNNCTCTTLQCWGCAIEAYNADCCGS